ncbi:hypothetical protein [Streptomyces sp. NPDC021608]|uniref:hypothetical protein n=1 Tax=Streptomyces sp. NPDC021608 TaxID=3154903 RepID=UPI0033C081DA
MSTIRSQSADGDTRHTLVESTATGGVDRAGPPGRQPGPARTVSGAEAQGPRFVALLLAALVIALGLSAMAGVHAVYQGKEQHRQDRTPVPQAAGNPRHSATRWLVGSDTLRGERRFSVVYLTPHTADAPLPPGLRHWPAPGEAVLSPALLKAGAGEDIERRYGRLGGTIGQEGLEDPGEWLAYVRPAAGLSAKQPTEIVTGFGPSAGKTSRGLEPGSGRADDQPEALFLAAVAGLLLLPGVVLLLMAVRLGASTRKSGPDTGAGPGEATSVRARSAGAGVIRPALLGAVVAALPVSAALLGDVRLPCTDYLLSSADLRSHAWLVTLGPLAAVPAVLVTAVLADRIPFRPTSARKLRSWLGERVTQWAGLCPLMIVLTLRGPELVSDARLRMGIVGAGVIGTALTLPAVAAWASAKLGPRLVRRGHRRGRPGVVAAGRLATAHPGTSVRVVAPVVVALIALVQAVAWQGLFGWQNTEGRATFDRVGRSVVDVVPNGEVTTEQMASFLGGLPHSRAVLLAPPSGDPEGPLSLQGDCAALETLHLPCPAAPVRLDRLPADTRLQELVKWHLGNSPDVEISRVAPADLAKRAAQDTTSTLALLDPHGQDLDVPALKALGYGIFPRGAGVKALGEDNITADVPNRDQSRWVVLLGIVGIAVVSVAAGCTAVSLFLRRARSLAARSRPADRTRALRGAALWSVTVPLAAAGVAGPPVAAWLTAPVGDGGPSYVTVGLLASSGGVVVAVGLLAGLCSMLIATRRAQGWALAADADHADRSAESTTQDSTRAEPPHDEPAFAERPPDARTADAGTADERTADAGTADERTADARTADRRAAGEPSAR